MFNNHTKLKTKVIRIIEYRKSIKLSKKIVIAHFKTQLLLKLH